MCFLYFTNIRLYDLISTEKSGGEFMAVVKDNGLYRISYKEEQEQESRLGSIVDYDELDERISKLDLHQRIRLLEFLVGMRDVNEITDKDEAELVAGVIVARMCGYMSPELNPDHWSLNKGRKR